MQRQLGELGATEYAAHVTVNPDNASLTADIWTSMNVSRASADEAVESFEANLDDPDFDEE